MRSEDSLALTDHDLGEGLVFRAGRLPDALMWDEPTFEQVWALYMVTEMGIFGVRSMNTRPRRNTARTPALPR